MDLIHTVLSKLCELNIYSVAFRIVLSTVVGGLIGLERGRTGHAAGLRTHILVAIGSAMTVMLGQYSVARLGFGGDPMRVSAQVISGIGFLGAGQIMTRGGSQVTGLTTAAGLWATASIGLAIGLGFYSAAFFSFLAVKLTITLLPRLELTMRAKGSCTGFYVELQNADCIPQFVKTTQELGAETRLVPTRSGAQGRLAFEITVEGEEEERLLKEAISHMHCVDFIVATT